jgi:hypothetical protein
MESNDLSNTEPEHPSNSCLKHCSYTVDNDTYYFDCRQKPPHEEEHSVILTLTGSPTPPNSVLLLSASELATIHEAVSLPSLLSDLPLSSASMALSDPGRKAFHTKIGERMTPAFLKSKRTKVAERASDTADTAARYVVIAKLASKLELTSL